MPINVQAIKKAMLTKRLTNKTLSEKAGMTVAGLNKILAGKSIPRLETIYNISMALDVNPEEIIIDE